MATARILKRGSKVSVIRKLASRSTAAVALEDARRAGLLDGDKTEHLSFRAPKALVEAAKRESGIESPTDLGILALATLAQPDPVASFLKRTLGKLGPGHELEF
ncbi:hypothetical protein NKH45_30290 [Mesorhizobium sp. M1156]|uniref:hypothetical protein n=1 Tax=Mesorhizobium sp. M1156 TaxID=2957064 RepID=UPI0033396A83